MKDSMYKNFQKSKQVVFSLLKFLHNKIESKNKFDYIFYSLQEVNYVMQKLLTTGIKLEEYGNFGINKFFTQESNQKKYNVASEYIISLTSSEVYSDSITRITLDYKIIFSNHSNEFTNAIIYPEEIKKVKELSANIGTKFKNTLYTEWNTYLGQKQIQSYTYPWTNNFDINKHKTSLRNNTHTQGYFKQFQNARDAKLHSNVLHGVIFELNDINFLLVNCHHPRLDNKWFEQLIRFNSMFQILDTWTTNNPTIENKIILTGDFNINYNTKEGKKVYDFLVSREFDQETIDIFNSFDVKPELYKKEIKNRFNNYNEEKFKSPDYKTQISKNRVGNNILDYIFVSSNIKQEGFDTHNKDIVVSDMNKYYTPTFVSRKIKSFSGNHSEGRYGLISDHGVEKLLLCLNKKNKFEKKDNISKQGSVSTISATNVLDINKLIVDRDNEIIKTHFKMCKSNSVYKRVQCYHYLKGCMKGKKCYFAHGLEEQTSVNKIHEFIRLYPNKIVNDFIEDRKIIPRLPSY
jgi:endonuclease/exonuclease/phosphatase family metal-dependent hydrolase